MVHYIQFHTPKQQIRPLSCLKERSLLYEWAIQPSKHRQAEEKQTWLAQTNLAPVFALRGILWGLTPLFEDVLWRTLQGTPKRWCRQFSKQTNNRIALHVIKIKTRREWSRNYQEKKQSNPLRETSVLSNVASIATCLTCDFSSLYCFPAQ